MLPKENRNNSKKLSNTETLYIIGNGFDLAHGMQSKIEHFGEYLQKADSFVYNIVKNCLDEGNWNNFEKSLEDPMDIIGPIMEQAINSTDICSPVSDDWRDGMNFAFQTSMDLHTTLANHFENWAHQIEQPKDAIIPLDMDALFITFNYTRTLEDLYKISESKILHLHGVVNGTSELLFGHNKPVKYSRKELPGYVFDEPYGELGNDEEVAFDIAYSAIKRMHKDVASIAESHKDYFNRLKTISRIIVMGVSCNCIDKLYFELVERTTKNNNPDWNISWYDSGEDKTAVNYLTGIGVPRRKITLFRIEDQFQ